MDINYYPKVSKVKNKLIFAFYFNSIRLTALF